MDIKAIIWEGMMSGNGSDCADLGKCEARLIWAFPDESGEIADSIKKRGEAGLPPFNFTHFEVGGNFHKPYHYLCLPFPKDKSKIILCDSIYDSIAKQKKSNGNCNKICLVALPTGLVSVHLRVFFEPEEDSDKSHDSEDDRDSLVLSNVRCYVSRWFTDKDPGAVVAAHLRQDGLLPHGADSYLIGAKPFYLVRIPLQATPSSSSSAAHTTAANENEAKVIAAICGLRKQVSITSQSSALPVQKVLDVLFDNNFIQVWSRGLMENGIVHQIPGTDGKNDEYCEYVAWLMNRLGSIVSNNLAAIMLARQVRHILAEDGFCNLNVGLSQRSMRLRKLESGMRMYFEHHVQIGSLLAAGLPQDTREAIDSVLADAGRRLDAAWSELLFDAIRIYNVAKGR